MKRDDQVTANKSPVTFGDCIRRYRFENNIQLKDLAEILDITPTAITRMELHALIPSPNVIIEIAHIIGMEPKKLLNICLAEKVEEHRKKLEKKYSLKTILKWRKNR